MGAVRNIQLSTASRLPTSRPTITSKALTPAATNSGPIISSVPAQCSPAYMPMKLLKPSWARAGTGSRSNSVPGGASSTPISGATSGSVGRLASGVMEISWVRLLEAIGFREWLQTRVGQHFVLVAFDVGHPVEPRGTFWVWQ